MSHPALRLTEFDTCPASGGEAHRYLADIQLRPVLSELGGVVPAPSLLLTEPAIGGYLDAVGAYARRHGPVIAAALFALAGSPPGPLRDK